jgi:hypothetical protein
MSYPGEIATIDCQGDETTVGVGVRNGTRVNVRGIEIRGCDIGIAYYDESGHSGLVEDNYIHSTDGTAANNPAGVIVYNGHDGLDVKHNLFEDNYDREGAVNENNSNIYYSQGMCNATYPVEIAYNTIITSLNSVQTAGIKFKHIDSGGCTNPSQADIHHNIVMGGAGGCIVSAAGDHIYRNICYNTGVCFWMGEHGGSNDIDDLLLEYNTCVPRSGSVGIYLDGDGDEDFDDITERYNIWHTNHTASGATAIFNVNHNGSSGEYSDLSGLDFDNSTYYNNGGTIAMSVYGGLDSARIYEGSTEWNAANDNGSSTGYGDAGYFGDPQLDVAGDITLEPSNANSTSHGVFADGATTTTTTTSTTSTSTTSTSTSTTSTSTSTTSTTTSTSTSTTTTTLPTTTTTTTLVPPENQGKRFPIGRGRGFGKYRRAEVWKYGQN